MSFESVALGQLVKFNPPTPKGLLATEAEVAIVPMASVSELGTMETKEYRPAREVSPGLSYFSSGDILIAKITPCYENNKIAVARVDRTHAFGSTEFHVARPDTTRINSRYLLHFLRQDRTRMAGTRRMTGSGGQRRVPKSFLEELKIPLPPLDEQRRIAAILDHADALRSKRAQAIRKLDGMAASLFFSRFGDWSRPNSTVNLVKLGAKLDFLTSGSRGWASFYRESGSLFVRIQNVRNDLLDLSDIAFVDAPHTAEAKRTRVQDGDVLMSITADLGRTAVVPNDLGEAFISQHLCILRSTYFNPRYLSAALASPAGQQAIQRKNREAVKAGLNFDDIRSLEIPDISRQEQDAFAGQLEVLDQAKRLQVEGLRQMNDLFASLQHRAFRGEL